MDEQTRQIWQNLPEVYVKLPKDDLGYPPKEWEELKAEQTDEKDVYRLKSVPFYARGLAYDDEVKVTTSPEGYYPTVALVRRRSGYSTMRLSIKESDKNPVVDYFTGKHCLVEFDGNLVAVAIPREAFEVVSEYICDEKDRGRWDAEDGFLIIDEHESQDDIAS